MADAKHRQRALERRLLGLPAERAETRLRSERFASLSEAHRERIRHALRIIGTRRCGGRRHGRKVSLKSGGLQFKFQWNADSGSWKELPS